MFKKYVPLAVTGLLLSAGAARADVTGTDITTALGNGATLLGSVSTNMLAVGGVIIGLACVGAGIKWVKGSIFS